MSSHITINGRTYASVEEMPPELRREYELAMKMLARAEGAAESGDADVSISTQEGDPAHRGLQAVTRMTSQRIIVNGKEYHDLNEVPAESRAALQDAIRRSGVVEGQVVQSSQTTSVRRLPGTSPFDDASMGSSTGITMGVATLIALLVLTVLAGMFLGAKLFH
jgi:hypothetical protein